MDKSGIVPRDSDQSAPRGYFGISHNVFVLGWVSFLTDVSSEMIFTALPLFLSNILGVGTFFIGLIEGLGDSAANVLKIASGWFSDQLGERKWITASGYGISTIVKPFLLIASSGIGVLFIRLLERAGKGIRISPRDALIADCTTNRTMGRGFGFQKAMDTFGAMVGIAIAASVIYFLVGPDQPITRQTFNWLVIIGVIPAVLAVLLIAFFVKEKRASHAEREAACPAHPPKVLDRRFITFLTVMTLFNLGNSADAFLVLRANSLGISLFYIFILLVLFNLVYAAVAYPAGRLSDRVGRKKLIVAGWVIYVASYLGLALASEGWHIILIVIVYGLYSGIAEGVCKAFVADVVPPMRRGTAYGLYHGAVGFALLLASVVAGALWQWVSPSAPFFFGAAMAAVAMVGFTLFIRENRPA
jgi:MFS family permease